ncbi:MAG: PorV/PorQ family protein [Candidatus Hydrogenedentota bacterium]
MLTYRSIYSIILFLVVTIFNLQATGLFADDKGTTSAQFLKIGVGARPGALANAYSSIGEDVISIFYNPGGLAFTEKAEISAMHNEYFQDINFDFIGLSFPVGKRHTLGTGLQLLKTTDTERSEYLGIVLSEFDIEDIAATFSYAYLLNERLGLGINGKYIREVLFHHSASTLAADVGVLFKTPFRGLNLGLSIQHLGGKLKFIQVSDPLPANIRFGISYKIFKDQALITVDTFKYRNEDPDGCIGFEWNFKNLLQLRAGYRFTSDLEPSDAITAGLGISYKDLSFDYAYVPYGELGNTHRFSGNFKFWKTERDITPKPPPATYITLPKKEVKVVPKKLGKAAIFKLTPVEELYRSELIEEEIKEGLKVILQEGGVFTVLSDEEMRVKMALAPESLNLENACRLFGTDYVIFGGYSMDEDKININISSVDSLGKIKSIQIKTEIKNIIREIRKSIDKIL